MFVSSYSTYISTDNQNKISKERGSDTKKTSDTFSSKLQQTAVLESKTIKNIPISYISNYKSFSNKQKLEQNLKNSNFEKYAKVNAQTNAKTAYAENSKMFSLVIKPSVTLNNIQKKELYIHALDIYRSNDKYYQITAA